MAGLSSLACLLSTCNVLFVHISMMPCLHLHSQLHMRAGQRQLTKHHLADPSPSMRPHWRLITPGLFPICPTSLVSQAICHHAVPDHTLPKHCASSNSTPDSFAATTLPKGQPQRTPRMQQAVHLSLFSRAMIGPG